MFFLKSFYTLFLLNILFYNNTFCGYSNQSPEIEKVELDNYIKLDDVKVMSINQPSCYCLCKETPETKVKDVSITIYEKRLVNTEFKEESKELKIKNLNEDLLDSLRITKVADGYYILLVYKSIKNTVYYLSKKNFMENDLLIYDNNILTIDKIKNGINYINNNDDDSVDFIFKINDIKDIKGLKIYKDPIELKIK